MHIRYILILMIIWWLLLFWLWYFAHWYLSASESHKSSNLFIGMSKLDEVEFEQLEAELNPVLSRLHDKFGRMPTMMELDENTAKVYRRYKQLRQALGRDR